MTRYLKWLSAVILLAVLVWTLPWSSEMSEIVQPETPAAAPEREPVRIKRVIKLYLPDRNFTGLESVSYELETGSAITDQITGALTAVIIANNELTALFPQAAAVTQDIFVYGKQVVISLDPGYRRKFQAGIWTEMLTVYSIVNTIIDNFDMIDKVLFLVDGKRADFFGGSLDISRPFLKDESFNKPDER